MKILTVVYSLGKGGTERAAQNFAEGYHNFGWDSRILGQYEGGSRIKELSQLEIKVWIGTHNFVFEEIELWEPDFIHVHSNGISVKGILKLKNICKKAQFVETNVFSVPAPQELSYQLSDWCHSLYISRGGSPSKSVVVPYPVKTENFHKSGDRECFEFREKYGIPQDVFLFGRIGQSYIGKWSHYIIDLFEKFLKEVTTDSMLLLVNPPAEIIDYCKQYNILEKILIIDSIIGDDDLRECYSSIDAFLHIANQGESFGFVLAESLLCETPVITWNTPWADNSQSEVIGDNIGGFCSNTKTEFFSYMKKIYSDTDLRRKMGKKGREQIIKYYNYKTVTNKSVKLLESECIKDDIIVQPIPKITSEKWNIKVFANFILALKFKNIISNRLANFLLRNFFKFNTNKFKP